ncbi:unnamed protein product [Pleuronectes platessa]|uniref:Uncharacterized protein n=1 Tax=Pleuronectes platessa TaxID=8262 RepID=A0A9N7UP30_PLEPL|nr:unnamed protein product [Pleuronectes platessa]
MRLVDSKSHRGSRGREPCREAVTGAPDPVHATEGRKSGNLHTQEAYGIVPPLTKGPAQGSVQPNRDKRATKQSQSPRRTGEMQVDLQHERPPNSGMAERPPQRTKGLELRIPEDPEVAQESTVHDQMEERDLQARPQTGN